MQNGKVLQCDNRSTGIYDFSYHDIGSTYVNGAIVSVLSLCSNREITIIYPGYDATAPQLR